MIVGIVGSEAAKFTLIGENRARLIIASILKRPEVTEVVSGACHLGGIDIWAIEDGKSRDLVTTEFKPERLTWEFYKKRNIQIAEKSDEVYCITVDQLPENFSGMRFKLCYHCGSDTHVKSGGCWTMKEAIRRGKKGVLEIVRNSL